MPRGGIVGRVKPPVLRCPVEARINSITRFDAPRIACKRTPRLRIVVSKGLFTRKTHDGHGVATVCLCIVSKHPARVTGIVSEHLIVDFIVCLVVFKCGGHQIDGIALVVLHARPGHEVRVDFILVGDLIKFRLFHLALWNGKQFPILPKWAKDNLVEWLFSRWIYILTGDIPLRILRDLVVLNFTDNCHALFGKLRPHVLESQNLVVPAVLLTRHVPRGSPALRRLRRQCNEECILILAVQ